MSSTAHLRRAVVVALLVAGTWAGGAAAAPAQSHHDITWYVHEDLIDVGSGLTLAYYQALIESSLVDADILLIGTQGPTDTPCCVGMDAVTVTTFSGAGLDVIETDLELAAVLDGPAGGYLVQSVWFCGGTFSTSIIGCGRVPGNTFIVSLDAENSDILAATMAHERGHNAGLSHVFNNPCELMAGSLGGGCLSIGECQSYITKADSTSGSCSCLDDALGNPPVADASACTGGFGIGLCSGAICGESSGPAGARLLAAGGTENADTAITDDALHQSPLAGGWSNLGAIGTGIEPTGMAYDGSRDVVFAVTPQGVGNDKLVTLDPVTGTLTGTVATLGYTGLTALAYDPTGDRLFGIQVDAEIFGSPFSCTSAPVCVSLLLQIDPDTGSAFEMGELNTLIISHGVQGLAWDSNAGVLYGSTAAGLFSIGLDCAGGACSTTSQIDNKFRRPSSLTYDPGTDTLYREGTRSSSRVNLEAIDPATGEVMAMIGVDGFTAGGLAIIPAPEPERWVMLASGLTLLAVVGRRRERADPQASAAHNRAP